MPRNDSVFESEVGYSTLKNARIAVSVDDDERRKIDSKLITPLPGVYRMYDTDDALLYVGKAKNLRKRVMSYFQHGGLGAKTQALVKKINTVAITVTHSEAEALLLEQNSIKSYQPPYNILLRDDKSYPYLLFADGNGFPWLSFRRNKNKKIKGRYYGPFPNSTAVRAAIVVLQKACMLRQCNDVFFRNRSRPCLQYQIKRCSAPCVGHIDAQTYQRDVAQAQMILAGQSSELVASLTKLMTDFANTAQYEQAAVMRDRIMAIRSVQADQSVTHEHGNIDAIATVRQQHLLCLAVVHVRNGQVLGSNTFFPDNANEAPLGALLEQFICQYYLLQGKRMDAPRGIVVENNFDSATVLGLLQQTYPHLEIYSNVRSQNKKWLMLAQTNAQQALMTALSHKRSVHARTLALQELLQLNVLPQRMECFDISHTMGEATVAACVVFDALGPVKAEYRKFNITSTASGDDYQAMREALQRRYQRVLDEQLPLPDIIFIDGGIGQLSAAEQILAALPLHDVLLVGVAKGLGRRPGLETLIISHFLYKQQQQTLRGQIDLDNRAPALHLIQHIRDEAHRFALTSHRAKRQKTRSHSSLENIAGIGQAKRQTLLLHFGGIRGIRKASARDIARVKGINNALAKRVYDQLHAVG